MRLDAVALCPRACSRAIHSSFPRGLSPRRRGAGDPTSGYLVYANAGRDLPYSGRGSEAEELSGEVVEVHQGGTVAVEHLLAPALRRMFFSLLNVPAERVSHPRCVLERLWRLAGEGSLVAQLFE
jgi:hypothetical protein